MYTYILAPLDGSRFSDSVVPYVGQLAKGLKLPVVLLHAVDPRVFHLPELEQRAHALATESYGVDIGQSTEAALPSQRSGDRRSLELGERHYLDQIIDAEKAAAEGYLLPLARALEKEGVEVERVVLIGEAPETILRFTEKRQGGLIAMATHGRSGLGRWAMGSVADKVLHGAAVPVLLIHPQEDGKPKTELGSIVVPLDGSPLSESVLPVVAQFAKALNVSVHLIQAIPRSTELYMGAEPYAYPVDMISKIEQQDTEYLDYQRDRLVAQGIEADIKVIIGTPDMMIVDYAGNKAMESLIVMATHGRSGVRRWILGSVADSVVRSSGRPVLLIRPME